MRLTYAACFLGVSLGLIALAAPKGPTTLLCEKEGGGTEKPKLVVKAGGGHTLFLCSYSEKREKQGTILSFVRVFAVNKAGKKLPGHVFQSSEMVQFKARKHGEALVLDELLWVGNEIFPTFETKIECTGAGCEAGEAACVFQPPKKTSTAPIAQAKALMKKSGRNFASDRLINQLARLAYSGDKEAQAIFVNRGTLSIDGEAGERYFDHQAMLERLKKKNCLSGPAAAN